MSIIRLIISFVLSFTQILMPIDALITSRGESSYFISWSETDVFDEDDYIELEKTPGEDFVILNLADIQLNDSDIYGDEGIYSKELISALIAENSPDLITLSGDNATGTVSYMEIIEFLDSFGIPWAPVMGNHEGDGLPNEFWAAYKLYEAENCLFEFGPEDMGYGNYIINITENGDIIHTLFMMDTHDSAEFTLDDGTVVEGYDHLWDNQQAWYEWAVKGTEALAGHPVESTVVMHIPLVEYAEAWDMVSIECEDGSTIINPVYASVASGRRGEDCCPSPVNNGFFELCKELGSTKTILAGHDHKNDFIIKHEGITLAYGVKSGFGSYWQESMIGGTTLNINSAGNVQLTQHYYDLIENGWNISAD